MVVKDLISSGVRMLDEAGIADAQIDAYLLFEAVTGIGKTMALYYQDKEVPLKQQEMYETYLTRRAAHEPCQYIIGSCDFMGLTFQVNEHVLIPRMDTEVLVMETLRRLPGNADVLDLCTGSGAIAIALQRHRPDVYPVAVDLSEEALEVAKANGKKNQCRITWLQSDLFEALEESRQFDIIVSNPPYVTEAEYETLMPEVKDHEPKLALLAGADGLDIYRRLIQEAPAYLKQGGNLLLEIGCAQAEAVSALMNEAGFTDFVVVKDLAGLDRVVIGKH